MRHGAAVAARPPRRPLHDVRRRRQPGRLHDALAGGARSARPAATASRAAAAAASSRAFQPRSRLARWRCSSRSPSCRCAGAAVHAGETAESHQYPLHDGHLDPGAGVRRRRGDPPGGDRRSVRGVRGSRSPDEQLSRRQRAVAHQPERRARRRSASAIRCSPCSTPRGASARRPRRVRHHGRTARAAVGLPRQEAAPSDRRGARGGAAARRLSPRAARRRASHGPLRPSGRRARSGRHRQGLRRRDRGRRARGARA